MVGSHGEGEERTLMIELIRKEEKYKCRCGQEFTARYDSRERCVRDLPYGPWKVCWLVFWQARVNCPECQKIRTESFDWVGPRVDYTKRLAGLVSLSCRDARSIKSVGKEYGLHVHTVKRMDKEALQEELPGADESSPRLIGVDEFSIRKHHHYATTVVDLETMEVPYVAEHRTKESLSGFYQALGPEKCSKIEAAAMDMWKPYEEATREHCANAAIIYDPFHIIASYGREVIDKVRVAEEARAEGLGKDVIKGSKYLLLKNAENLDPERDEPARLADLLRLNRRLSIVYLLKDDLKELWRYRSPAWALKWFNAWRRRAVHSRIDALKKFARKLEGHLPGIIAHCQYPIHTGFLEGVNNKIKVIKRVAYGFHDLEYFFLKIRGAFQHE